jgi:predicted  nucleic acid-binding Zn-ribbon protein
LTALETEFQTTAEEAARVTEEWDALAKRESDLEAELAATEQRAATVSRRLYGGEVSASRELQAMAADVENLNARASELEDQGLVLLEEREPLDARLAELQSRLTDIDSRRHSVAATLADAESTVDAEIAQLEQDRKKAVAAVPADLLANYERLRARLGGVGAARLVGNHCDGCHLALSAAELDRIRRLGPGQMVTCEQCSRILVPE